MCACSYAVLIDGEDKKSGSLFEDFDPSVNPSEEIDDPSDTKPSDWVENPKYAPCNNHMLLVDQGIFIVMRSNPP